MDSRRGGTLHSRYNGTSSPWDRAKMRAEQANMFSKQGALHLPTDYLKLKGDYSGMPNATLDPYNLKKPTSNLPGMGALPSAQASFNPYGRGEEAYRQPRDIGSPKEQDRPYQENPCPNLPGHPDLHKSPMARQELYNAVSPGPGAAAKVHFSETHEARPSEANYNIDRGALNLGSPDSQRAEHNFGAYEYSRQTPVANKETIGNLRPEQRETLTTPLPLQRPVESPYPNPAMQKAGENPPMNFHSNKSDYELPRRPPDYGPALEQSLMNKPGYGEIPAQYRDARPPEMPAESPQGALYSENYPSQNNNPQDVQQEDPTKPLPESQKLPFNALDSMALKGLRRIRTTNQTYGSWIGDPILEGKDWYRNPRYPQIKSYLTRHKEESGSWIG